MLEPISIFEVIRRGGYEASLISTYNAHLPFYEEVVLRKLVGVGCRHNVLLMDRSQCAVSWASEATRPRLAGHAYTLVPIGVSGAFHPKLCILAGPKRAAVLVGSHNLTLSGFGFNREISNWIEVDGDKDSDGVAVLAEAWRAACSWIELERGKSPDLLLDSAIALTNFVVPLLRGVAESPIPTILSQAKGGIGLLEQLASQVPGDVTRIAVIGAFFDVELAFIEELTRRWPNAEAVVGVDPETVICPGRVMGGSARMVDARAVWNDLSSSYLHAKAIYFEAGDLGSIFASGSANPSRPAWMATPSSGNVEAIFVRRGREAVDVATDTGLVKLFALPTLESAVLSAMARRGSSESMENPEPTIPVLVGVADRKSNNVHIQARGNPVEADSAELLGLDAGLLVAVPVSAHGGEDIVLTFASGLGLIRSCRLLSRGRLVARVLVHHPDSIAAVSQSTRQYQIRAALGALGSSDGDISGVIAAVEKVIFSDDTQKEVKLAVRQGKEVVDPKLIARPERLGISITELPKETKKLRLLKSGDLAYLIDVLMRRLGEGLEGEAVETDPAGRNEEEQVGKDDEETKRDPVPGERRESISDIEVARAVVRKARQLIQRMVAQLERAAKDQEGWPTAIMQLTAVLALLRELRHLDKSARWRKTGEVLVEARDRRLLLDRAVEYLLGSNTRLLSRMRGLAPGPTEEEAQLRLLMLWLAWDLGDELTDQIGRLVEQAEVDAQLRANAVFLELIPPLIHDERARPVLEQCVQHTARATPQEALRGSEWVERLWSFGSGWADGYSPTVSLRIGTYACVPGVIDEPRIVLHVSSDFVGLWDFDKVRQFQADRVKAIGPKPPSGRALESSTAMGIA